MTDKLRDVALWKLLTEAREALWQPANPDLCGRIDEALAQQEAQAESQGWRSMDTAPLGVTAFFWIKWSDVPVIGEWDGKSLSANHEHLDVSCGAYCYGGSVCTAGHTEPTLWMPLPPAPDAAPTPPAQEKQS